MNRRFAFGLCPVALVTISALPNSGIAHGKLIKDQPPTQGRIRLMKIQRRFTPTSRRAHFKISSEHLISAGSSRPIPLTK
jgi:hypothetical protein